MGKLQLTRAYPVLYNKSAVAALVRQCLIGECGGRFFLLPKIRKTRGFSGFNAHPTYSDKTFPRTTSISCASLLEKDKPLPIFLLLNIHKERSKYCASWGSSDKMKLVAVSYLQVPGESPGFLRVNTQTFGAPNRIRTCGLSLRRRTLYPLSYRGWTSTILHIYPGAY